MLSSSTGSNPSFDYWEPSTVQGSIDEFCTFNDMYTRDTKRPVSQVTFQILHGIKDIPLEKFKECMENHFSPPMEACLHQAIKTNNLVVLDYICTYYPHAMNFPYNSKLEQPSAWNQQNLEGWIPVDSNGSDEKTALEHAYDLSTTTKTTHIFKRLLQYGANTCPINREMHPSAYAGCDERVQNIHDRAECDCVGKCASDSDESLSDSELQLVNPLFHSVLLFRNASDDEPVYENFISAHMPECLEDAIRAGAKKCYTFNLLTRELAKETYFQDEYRTDYQQAKQKFLSTKVKIAFIAVWQSNALGFIPRDIIHQILTDKEITPYHKRVTLAKREIRKRAKETPMQID